MARKQRKSPQRLAVEKELKRLTRAIKEIGKAGYDIQYTIPKRGSKSLTAYAKQLHEVTRADIRKKSTFEIDGEKISGTEAFKRQRSESARRGWETRRRPSWKDWYSPRSDDAIDGESYFVSKVRNILEELYSPDEKLYSRRKGTAIEASGENVPYIIDLLNSAIEEEGINTFAWRLADDVNKLEDAAKRVLYGSTSTAVQAGAVECAVLIKGTALTFQDRQRIEAEKENESWDDEY